ncbi:MAG TPA: DUF58 domain-containing protein [Bryobacteraceae bacterium]|nr:DUF58 domain-containing protein [Bryobacteraceae bacterium]
MPEPLIDQKFLERLERLTLHWQKSFPGLVGGHNASRYSGAGQEFLDHRGFHQGDDLRAVNWRAYMRLEKLILKLFQVEPRVPVRILLDTSASMTTGEPSKFDFGRKLAAALTYVGLVRLETILLQPFDSALHDPITCGGGRHRFRPVVNYLEELQPTGPSNFAQALRQFIAEYPQRGLVILISDFLDERECEKPLQYLADFGHEVFLIHLWGEDDRRPPYNGELEIEDAETGQSVKLNFDDEARAAYVEAFDNYARSIRDLAMRKGGRYIGVSTATSIEQAIFGSFVEARSA